MIVSNIPELKIVVDGEDAERTLKSPGSCLELHGHTTIEGEGELRLISENGAGIEERDGKRLTVSNKLLDVSGATGALLGSNGTLYVEKTLYAGSPAGAVRGFGFIWWDEVNAALTWPLGGRVSDGAIVNEEGKAAPTVNIVWSQPYDIWIDGERITSGNWLSHKNDLLFYNPVSNILYIRGGSYTGSGYEPIVRSSIQGLRISVHGDTTLTMPDGAMCPIFELSGDTSIGAVKGKTLRLECGEWAMNACVEVWNSTLTLQNLDGLTLRHGGRNALQGGGDSAALVVEESVVTAESLSGDPYSGAVAWFKGGIELRGCALREPVSWGFDGDGSLTNGAGQLAKRVVIERTPKLTIRSRSASSLSYRVEYLPEGGEALRLVAAAYDANGKLLDRAVKSLSADGSTAEGTISVGKAAVNRLFLLDSSNRPVAEYAE